jgi:hypothetical protein
VIDETGARAAIAELPSQLAPRSHGAIHASIDVELIAGLAWISGGWAWSSAGRAPLAQSPAGVALAGHTLALGVELVAGDVTVDLGWAHIFGGATDVDRTEVQLVNPFAGGTAPAVTGTLDEDRDVIGLGVELAWP